MADPHVISSLQDKIYDLRSAIVTYEESLERARQELAVMTAALTVFARDGGRITSTTPANARNLFKRGEVLVLCKEALAASPDGLTTRELAVSCLAARQFDYEDPVLVRAMTGLLSNTLGKAVRRRELEKVGSDPRKVAWRLARNLA